MNKTINFLVTCTVFVLAIQSYAKSETTIVQTPTNEPNLKQLDDVELNRKQPNNNKPNREQQNNEELIREGLRREQPSNHQIEREEQNLHNNNGSSQGLNREDIKEDNQLERESGTFEEHRSQKPKIRDVKAPNYGAGSVPAQPPADEAEIKF